MNRDNLWVWTILAGVLAAVAASSLFAEQGSSGRGYRLLEEQMGDLRAEAKDVGDFSAFGELQKFAMSPTDINPVVSYKYVGSGFWRLFSDIEVSGNYAYCAASFGLLVLDISNPSVPVLAAMDDSAGVRAYSLELAGSRAFLGTYSGLYIYDISAPTSPVVVAHLPKAIPFCQAMRDTLLFTIELEPSNSHRLLSVYSVPQPGSPSLLSSLDLGINYWYDIELSDTVLVGTSDFTLWSFNVADPLNMTNLGSQPCPFCDELSYDNNRVYAASYPDSISVYDLSLPATPVLLRRFSIGLPPRDIVVKNSIAYIATDTNSVCAYNFANINSPVLLGKAAVSRALHPSLTVVGTKAYLVEDEAGAAIIDFASPSTPSVVGTYEPEGASSISVQGNLAFIGGALNRIHIVDVSNRTEPVPLSYFQSVTGVTRSFPLGSRLYLASSDFGLNILDISNPSLPVSIGSYDTPGNAQDVYVVGDTAYVADGANGVIILNVANPGSIQLIGQVDAPSGDARDIQPIGNRLYVADGDAGVQIISKANPNSPLVIGNFNPSSYVLSCKASGTTLFITSLDSLYIVDAAVASSLTRLKSISTGATDDVLLDGSFVQLAAGYSGLILAYDVAEASCPSLAGRYIQGGLGYSKELARDGNFIYLAAEDNYIILERVITNQEVGIRPVEGWTFQNSEANMWPPSEWSSSNYCASTSPCTRKCWTCAASDFPSWSIFVEAIGSANAYFDPGPIDPKFRPSAVAQWNAIKGEWSGSCYGFVASTLLFYRNLLDVDSVFSGSSCLSSVALSNASRDFINRMALYQFDELQQRWIDSALANTTPFQVLEQVKQLVDSGNAQGRVLLMFNQNGSGAHAVLPFSYKFQAPGRYIAVRDPNSPPDLGIGVFIDSIANTWLSYQLSGWGGSGGLILVDPANGFPGKLQLADTSSTQNIRFYHNQADSVLISSPSGQIGHNGNVEFNTVSGAHPIVPFDGKTTSPLGYFLPTGEWFWEGTGIIDGAFYVVDGNKRVFRSGGAKSGIISASYHPNAATLTVYGGTNKLLALDRLDLEVITIEPDSEVVVSVENIELTPSDSLRLSLTPGAYAKLQNFGNAADYNVRVQFVSATADTVFYHADVDISANTTHLIGGNWRDSDSLLVLVDVGHTGSYTDSLYLLNTGEDIYICGDANGSGAISISDVVYLINYIFAGGSAPSPLAAGDSNCSGAVNISDAVYLVNYIFSGGAAPCSTCN